MSGRHPGDRWKGAKNVGARLRRLRLMSGMSQPELASWLGIDSGVVSRFENGRVLLDDDQIRQICRILKCQPEFATMGDSMVAATRPMLRAYADASQRTVKQQIAHCTTVMEVIGMLGLETLPNGFPMCDIDPADDEEIESFASAVRGAAGFDEDDVVSNCIRAAERIGVVVLPMSNELGRHLGLSLRVDSQPFMCISRNSSSPGDRQRYTVAHELGHLALHGHLPPPQFSEESRELERQANRFAGAFLAPADALVDDLREQGGRVTLNTLARLKARWGVSIKALVMRFRDIGIIDGHHARSLFKQISSRGWNKGEPVPVGHEEAIWLSKALNRKTSGHGSLDSIAAQIGISRSYIEQWINWSDHEADVVELPVKHGGAPTRTEASFTNSR